MSVLPEPIFAVSGVSLLSYLLDLGLGLFFLNLWTGRGEHRSSKLQT